jgi:hypothetical protein
MITYPYEHTYVHPISMSIFKRLTQFDLEIYKVGHQEHFAVDGDVSSH